MEFNNGHRIYELVAFDIMLDHLALSFLGVNFLVIIVKVERV